MARPKKHDHERREASIPPIRLTFAELAHVEAQAKAAALSVSAYARARCLGHAVAPRRSPVETGTLAELNSCGVNLNQIARHLNQGRGLPPEFAHVLHRFNTVLEQLARRYGA